MSGQDQQLIDLALSVLQFNILLLTLILGAQGFALGRIWPEKKQLPPSSAFWLLPGFALALTSVVLLASDYRALAAGVSGNEVPGAFKKWLNSYWLFHYSLAASILLTSLGIVIARKPRG